MNQDAMTQGAFAHHEAVPEEFLALGRQLAQERARLEALRNGPVRPFLLFERWRDNHMAAHFEDRYPQQAAERIPVPDDLYEEQPEDAPCIVPLDARVLPADPGERLSDYLAHEWLGHFLQQAWDSAQQRRSLQGLCGVLFTPVSGRILARHLVQLGYQNAPDGQPRLLRYQDPRVQQRVWPALNAEQRQAWLGPVGSWWSLQVPWGPIVQSSPVVWFSAALSLPSAQGGRRHPVARSRLLDPRQWLIAHAVAPANALWQRYEQQDVASHRQPSAMQVAWLLAVAFDCSIQAAQLEKFLLCVWHPYLTPQSFDSTPLEEGGEEQLRARCARVAHEIRQNPQAGYRELLTLVAAQTPARGLYDQKH